MNDKLICEIQREAAEALLDVGVSLPIVQLRLPFCKRMFSIRATMQRPTLAGQIAIAREYTKLGVKSSEVWNYTKEEQMNFIATHGKTLSRMIALCFCRGVVKRKLLLRPMAWLVRNAMPQQYMLEAVQKFVVLIGTDPFIPIIRSAEAVNPLAVRLSQQTKGS